MKRFLLFLVLMSAIPAYATVEVQYNNAGAVKNSTSQFGQNALFTPENAARAGARQRQIKYENLYYQNLGKPRNTNININMTKEETFDENAKPSTVKERTFLKGKYLKDKLNKQTTD